MTTGLRRSAAIEGISLALLTLVAVPIKYWGGYQKPVEFIGPLHGMAFLVFLYFLIRAIAADEVGLKEATRLFLGAFIPLGGIVNERWLRQRDSARHPSGTTGPGHFSDPVP
ncbi:DUF3817 domain-containing protein [Pyruvatibacter mobilis]|uniref:DUF3817 domain-containing protein n=1 Tax=Pyruvatibacter mobilis TaxID=1712261 RepID=UPI003BA885FB